MNYQKIYRSLILKAIARKAVKGYFEAHHIVPKCFGGIDGSSNIAILTPEEHYVAHQLLVKMYPGDADIIWAAIAMTSGKGRGRKGNKLYGWLRRRNSKQYKGKPRWSQEVKDRIGEAARLRNQGKNHPMYGRKHSEETIAKMRAAKLGKKASAKTRAKMRRIRANQPMSNRTKMKIATANRAKAKDPLFIAKLVEAAKLRIRNDSGMFA